MERIVYNITEVADLLGISRSYAYQLVKENALPVLSLGKRKVIPKKALETWMKEQIGTIQSR